MGLYCFDGPRPSWEKALRPGRKDDVVIYLKKQYSYILVRITSLQFYYPMIAESNECSHHHVTSEGNILLLFRLIFLLMGLETIGGRWRYLDSKWRYLDSNSNTNININIRIQNFRSRCALLFQLIPTHSRLQPIYKLDIAIHFPSYFRDLFVFEHSMHRYLSRKCHSRQRR